MRRIVNSTYITLDGVVEEPHNWPALPGGQAAESDAVQAELLGECDTVLIGRRTYEVFAPVWPTYEGVVADRMNAAKKVIVSSTITDPAWGPATVVSGDVAAQVAAMKQEKGLDIVQYGFGAVTRLLLEHDLLDELHLWLFPLTVGEPSPQDMIGHYTRSTFFEAQGAQTLSNGIVIVRYSVLHRS